MNARIASCVLTSLLLAGAAHANPATPAPAKLASNSFNAPARVTDTRFDAAAHVERGYNLLRQGKHDQAVKMFDKVIADSERQFAGDMRPRLCRSDGQDEAGAIVVDKALCEAHFGKGFALIDLGRGDLAENELRKASQMAPANAHFTNEYAELFKSRRDWQQSYDLFAKAWAVVDKTTGGADTKVAARALRGMGFTKAAMGQFDAAKGFYEQSLQYDPGSAIARAELGNIARRTAIGS